MVVEDFGNYIVRIIDQTIYLYLEKEQKEQKGIEVKRINFNDDGTKEEKKIIVPPEIGKNFEILIGDSQLITAALFTENSLVEKILIYLNFFLESFEVVSRESIKSFENLNWKNDFTYAIDYSQYEKELKKILTTFLLPDLADLIVKNLRFL
jgi:hypothetical protein